MPMDAVIIGFAFSAGAVAFLNPCGFAMLPTYVSYFVESNTQNIITASSNSRLILVKRLARAGSVGLLVTAAFIITFGLTGIAISSLGIGIAKFLPWIALSSGIVIIGIGVAKAFGKTMRLNIPSPRGFFYSVHGSRSSNDGKEIGYPSFFLFRNGIFYCFTQLYPSTFLACCFPRFVNRRHNGRFYCIFDLCFRNGKCNDCNFYCNKCIKPDICEIFNETCSKNEYYDESSFDTCWKLFDLL
jgi:hypothetical protein